MTTRRNGHAISAETRLVLDNRNACTEARRRLEAAGMNVTAEMVRRDRRGFALTVEMMLDGPEAVENLTTVMRNVRITPSMA